jgi:glycosyltransferase involved in cell wall biosynthesis
VTRDIVAAVIPAWNEEQTIAGVVEEVRAYVDEIIVVDDGSTDATAERAREAGAQVDRHERNRGYDQSIEYGFSMAGDLGADIVFTFDADGQHHATDIPKITGPIASGELDVVVGLRPAKARASEWLFSLYTRSRLGISDPLCGFKAYRIGVYDDVGHFDTRSTIGTQLMLEAKKRGYTVGERPIQLSERKDNSRFGHRLSANKKIVLALSRLVRYDILFK